MALRFKNNKDLLKKIRRGDKESFELFYKMESEKIYKFVNFKINNSFEAEEIVQDVFFNFWDYVRQGKEVNDALGLLYKIARNKIIDYYRKNGIRPKILSLDNGDGYQLASNKINDQDIENELDISFEIKSVEQVMMVELPDDYKDVLIMHFVREMKMAEIAAVINKSEGAVRVMIYRALKLLKKLLNEKNE